MSGDSAQTQIRESYFVSKQRADDKRVDVPPFGSRSCHREEMKAETFDGAYTDLQEYLSHFELLAKWNGWSRVEKDIQLAMSPRGAAQQVLGRNCEAEDYESLTAILKK